MKHGNCGSTLVFWGHVDLFSHGQTFLPAAFPVVEGPVQQHWLCRDANIPSATKNTRNHVRGPSTFWQFPKAWDTF